MAGTNHLFLPTTRMTPPRCGVGSEESVHGDKGYDTDAIRRQVKYNWRHAEHPAQGNRHWRNCFSPALYRGRNAIERMFCGLKDFRRVANRFDHLATNFLVMTLIFLICPSSTAIHPPCPSH
jgi:hypothetical protein